MSISVSRSSIVTGRMTTAGSVTGRPGGSLVVDLCPLEPATEVDVDRLPLGVRVEGGVAGLPVAVPGVLPAAEGQMRLGAGRAGVDVDDPRLEIAHGPERGV